MFEQEVKRTIKRATKLKNINLEIPPNPEFGDYAFPCFELAKKLKKHPAEIAKDLEKTIKPNKIVNQVKAIGPYLNIFINKQALAEAILPKIFKEKINYGKNKTKKSKILIESPGPNTNKPLHLGHVRNLCLGQSLNNLLTSQGNTIFPVNINNDRGIHICKSMLAYKKWGKNKTPESENIKPDLFVGNFYVLFNKKAKQNPKLEDEAKELLQKWENKDSETIALWKKMNKWAYQGFKQTYKKFNISFEKEYYESDTYKKGKKIIKKGLKSGIFEKDDSGAIYIDLKKENLGKKILLRADGTSVYITQDIYLAKKRYEDFKFDKLIYIVGNEQIYHFKVLFKILEKLGYAFAKDLYHFSYGMINLTTGKMKSREGKVVDADNLIEKLTNLAKKEIKKRYPKIKESRLNKRAEKIAMSAIRFYILKHDSLKDFTFHPQKSISFEGETGPYIQYTYARINSIIKKSQQKPTTKINFKLLKEKEEKILIKKLEEYPELLKESSEKYKISLIPHYLLELAQSFNSYYHNIQIIQENKELEKARILLIYSIQQILKTGLNILGIETMGEM
jgi:arginyl-tRNA synthetase